MEQSSSDDYEDECDCCCCDGSCDDDCTITENYDATGPWATNGATLTTLIEVYKQLYRPADVVMRARWYSDYGQIQFADAGAIMGLAYEDDVVAAVESVAKPPVDLSRFPHTCARCGSPAYIGFASVECSDGACGK